VLSALRYLAYIVLPAAGAILLLSQGHGEWAVILLTGFVLVVATFTLQATTVGPGRIEVERQHELEYSDLIFSGSDSKETPREILLQFHVAAMNVGGRKAVLSRLQLLDFLDAAGVAITPVRFSLPVEARVFRQTLSYTIEHGVPDQQHRVETSSPPLVLEPDDVVTLQFRRRTGIDWGNTWKLEDIGALVASLERPIVRARLRIIYRRGRTVVTTLVEMPIDVVKQDEYVARIRALTNDLTVMPQVPAQHIDLE
jgi:hypothetical protein